jgi:hypothetical protein
VTALASADDLEFGRSLGADEAIDYNAGGFTRKVRDQDAVWTWWAATTPPKP